MKLFVHLAIVLLATALVAPAAARDDPHAAYGIPRAMPSDYYKAAASAIDARYGIPRAMPLHYAAGGITLGHQSRAPRAMPSDYLAAGVGIPQPQPAAAGLDGSWVQWRDTAVGAAIGFTVAGVLAAGAVAVVRSRRRFAS